VERTLSLSQKLNRLHRRLSDADWRKYGTTLLLGKFAAAALLLLIVILVNPDLMGFRAFAASLALESRDIVNPVNTMWTLIAAFLIFAMQVGFTMLEAGFCRSRETANVLTECLVDTCLSGLVFYAFGFAFLFGHGNGFIGHQWFFLQGAPATYGTTGVAFLAVWIFQFAFADTCSTITSAAMTGRTGFLGDLIYSVAVAGFIYPIIGHWAWGPDGFLAAMGSAGNFLPSLGLGFHDFAGSTVIHSIGGFIALAGSIVLGPRLGRKFKRDGGGQMTPHDLTIAACGGLLLWFGWYGFNPGSGLAVMDFESIGRVAANTTLAACAAGLTAIGCAYFFQKKWDGSYLVNGFLAGLVAIACPCYWVTPIGSLLLGGVAGIVFVLGAELLEWLRIDDPLGTVPVHGICGVWGAISLGLFAAGKYGSAGAMAADTSAPLTGLFYGGGATLLLAQCAGTLIIALATFAVAMAVLFAVNAAGLLRADQEAAAYGLDLYEHGASAYPEAVISSASQPAGIMAEAAAPTLATEAMGRVGLSSGAAR
jgi:Amt family ammonium transporter